MNDEIHSCSYECLRPACILRQRDELFEERKKRRFAGWFRETSSSMNHRVWVQGGKLPEKNEVPLYEI